MDIREILVALYPGKQWIMRGESYENFIWLEDSTKPSEETLAAAWEEVQHKIELSNVESDRANAYRVEADPIFFKYQAGEATEKEWKQARQAVKTAHPYPEQK